MQLVACKWVQGKVLARIQVVEQRWRSAYAGFFGRVFDQFIDRARAEFPEFDHCPGIGDPCVPRDGAPPDAFQCGGDRASGARYFGPFRVLPSIEVEARVQYGKRTLPRTITLTRHMLFS